MVAIKHALIAIAATQVAAIPLDARATTSSTSKISTTSSIKPTTTSVSSVKASTTTTTTSSSTTVKSTVQSSTPSTSIKATTSSASTSSKASSAVATPTTWWKPTLQDSFQMQLGSDNVDTSPDVTVFDIDYERDPSVVKALKAKGKRVIAYIDAGSWESWRSDASAFPSSVIGGNMHGWEGEKWLDISQIDVLRPIMLARAKKAQAVGFDGIDWDNMDVYTQDTTETQMPWLDYDDQIIYANMLTNITHGLGMAVGLKNNLDQMNDLVGLYDFAVVESCQDFTECNMYQPFIKAGKPVISIEYKPNSTYICKNAPTQEKGAYVLFKDANINAGGWDCKKGKSIL